MSSRLLVLLALALTAVGEVEVLLRPAPDGRPLVSALAVPALALPVAWCGRAPVGALALAAVVLLVQAALGGFLVGAALTTIAVLAVLLYIAGRQLTGTWSFIGAGAAATVIGGTRIAFDESAQDPRQVPLTFLALACPLLIGRWARGQGLLRRELAEKAARRKRDRARDARHAADRERARIAADLQVAVASSLRAIAGHAEGLPELTRAGAHASARERLELIADAARAALADVRRVLGVLRHDGDAPLLTPPRTGNGPAAAPNRDRPPSAQPVPADSPEPEPSASRSALRSFATNAIVVDWVLAAAVIGMGAIELTLVAPGAAPLTAVGIAVPLLWRRARPVVVLAAVMLSIAAQSLLLDLDSFPLANMLAMVTASYAVGAYAERRAGFVALLLAGSAAMVHAAVFYPEGIVPAPLAGVLLPFTVGRIVNSHRRLTLAERTKAGEIERSRAREAAAAVTSERLRIARELHDAVAHSISVISIQAGGAAGIVERDRERAAEIAELVGQLAREALAELDQLAELPAAGATPSLADVERLVAPARAAGVQVELQVDERARALPAGIDLAAFRIVQEALTNTAKHAHADHAWVTVRCPGPSVELEIADDGRGPNGRRPTSDGGHGLVGLRERVALYGGSLDLGRHPSGGFLVTARLPLDSA